MAIARVRALTREKPQSTDATVSIETRAHQGPHGCATGSRPSARPGACRAAVGAPTGQSNPPGPLPPRRAVDTKRQKPVLSL